MLSNYCCDDEGDDDDDVDGGDYHHANKMIIMSEIMQTTKFVKVLKSILAFFQLTICCHDVGQN